MNRTLAIALPLAAALSGCQTTDELPTDRLGQATLRLANGLPAGTVQLLASGSQLNVSVALAGVPEGVHGVHLHKVGSCEAPGFESAGGQAAGQPQGRLTQSVGGQLVGGLAAGQRRGEWQDNGKGSVHGRVFLLV